MLVSNNIFSLKSDFLDYLNSQKYKSKANKILNTASKYQSLINPKNIYSYLDDPTKENLLKSEIEDFIKDRNQDLIVKIAQEKQKFIQKKQFSKTARNNNSPFFSKLSNLVIKDENITKIAGDILLSLSVEKKLIDQESKLRNDIKLEQSESFDLLILALKKAIIEEGKRQEESRSKVDLKNQQKAKMLYHKEHDNIPLFMSSLKDVMMLKSLSFDLKNPLFISSSLSLFNNLGKVITNNLPQNLHNNLKENFADILPSLENQQLIASFTTLSAANAVVNGDNPAIFAIIILQLVANQIQKYGIDKIDDNIILPITNKLFGNDGQKVPQIAAAISSIVQFAVGIFAQEKLVKPIINNVVNKKHSDSSKTEGSINKFTNQVGKIFETVSTLAIAIKNPKLALPILIGKNIVGSNALDLDLNIKDDAKSDILKKKRLEKAQDTMLFSGEYLASNIELLPISNNKLAIISRNINGDINFLKQDRLNGLIEKNITLPHSYLGNKRYGNYQRVNIIEDKDNNIAVLTNDNNILSIIKNDGNIQTSKLNIPAEYEDKIISSYLTKDKNDSWLLLHFARDKNDYKYKALASFGKNFDEIATSNPVYYKDFADVNLDLVNVFSNDENRFFYLVDGYDLSNDSQNISFEAIDISSNNFKNSSLLSGIKISKDDRALLIPTSKKDQFLFLKYASYEDDKTQFFSRIVSYDDKIDLSKENEILVQEDQQNIYLPNIKITPLKSINDDKILFTYIKSSGDALNKVSVINKIYKISSDNMLEEYGAEKLVFEGLVNDLSVQAKEDGGFEVLLVEHLANQEYKNFITSFDIDSSNNIINSSIKEKSRNSLDIVKQNDDFLIYKDKDSAKFYINIGGDKLAVSATKTGSDSQEITISQSVLDDSSSSNSISVVYSLTKSPTFNQTLTWEITDSKIINQKNQTLGLTATITHSPTLSGSDLKSLTKNIINSTLQSLTPTITTSFTETNTSTPNATATHTNTPTYNVLNITKKIIAKNCSDLIKEFVPEDRKQFLVNEIAKIVKNLNLSDINEIIKKTNDSNLLKEIESKTDKEISQNITKCLSELAYNNSKLNPNKPKDSSNSNNNRVIAISASVGGGILLGVCFACLCVYKKRSRKKSNDNAIHFTVVNQVDLENPNPITEHFGQVTQTSPYSAPNEVNNKTEVKNSSNERARTPSPVMLNDEEDIPVITNPLLLDKNKRARTPSPVMLNDEQKENLPENKGDSLGRKTPESLENSEGTEVVKHIQREVEVVEDNDADWFFFNGDTTTNSQNLEVIQDKKVDKSNSSNQFEEEKVNLNQHFSRSSTFSSISNFRINEMFDQNSEKLVVNAENSSESNSSISDHKNSSNSSLEELLDAKVFNPNISGDNQSNLSTSSSLGIDEIFDADKSGGNLSEQSNNSSEYDLRVFISDEEDSSEYDLGTLSDADNDVRNNKASPSISNDDKADFFRLNNDNSSDFDLEALPDGKQTDNNKIILPETPKGNQNDNESVQSEILNIENLANWNVKNSPNENDCNSNSSSELEGPFDNIIKRDLQYYGNEADDNADIPGSVSEPTATPKTPRMIVGSVSNSPAKPITPRGRNRSN